MTPKLSVLASLNNKSQSAVLRFLLKSRAEWSGREIARQAGVSAPACHQALKQLDARGLVLFRRVSNLHLYKINSDNYMVAKVLAPLFKAEAELPEQVLKTVKDFLAPYCLAGKALAAVVFGSMATGKAGLGSDMDLLVVASNTAAAKALEAGIQDLRGIVYRKFSIPLSPYIQPLAEIRAKHKNKLPLVQRILAEGQPLCGKPLRDLL